MLEEFERRGRITSLHPRLYKGLLKEALKVILEEVKVIESDLKSNVICKFREALGEPIDVNISAKFKDLTFVGADASSRNLPIAAIRMAILGGIALSLKHEDKPTAIWEGPVVCHVNEISGSEFRHLYQWTAERLIPSAVIDQLDKFKDVEGVLIDGPLSDSSLLRNVQVRSRRDKELEDKIRRRLQEAADSLVKARDILIRECQRRGIPIIGVVKRSTARYFQHCFNITCKYTDAYIFQQLLKYGQRSRSISITEAISKTTSTPSKLSYEIYGFYIKTSRNPLINPIRVEYPSYLKGEEDWIASYVLSTAVQSFHPKYDGIPVIQCMADRLTRITKEVVTSIYERALINIAGRREVDMRLLSYKRGFTWS